MEAQNNADWWSGSVGVVVSVGEGVRARLGLEKDLFSLVDRCKGQAMVGFGLLRSCTLDIMCRRDQLQQQ
jgi:hypothetical protein